MGCDNFKSVVPVQGGDVFQVGMQERSINLSTVSLHIMPDPPFELVPEGVAHVDPHGDFGDVQHFSKGQPMPSIIEKQGSLSPDVNSHFIVIPVGLIPLEAYGLVEVFNVFQVLVDVFFRLASPGVSSLGDFVQDKLIVARFFPRGSLMKVGNG